MFDASVKKDIPGLLYAGLVGVGGVMGYVKAGSIPSLCAGVISSGILFYGVERAAADPKKVDVVLGTSLLLMAIMGRRFIATQKIMPPGVVALMSGGMAARYGMRLLD